MTVTLASAVPASVTIRSVCCPAGVSGLTVNVIEALVTTFGDCSIPPKVTVLESKNCPRIVSVSPAFTTAGVTLVINGGAVTVTVSST